MISLFICFIQYAIEISLFAFTTYACYSFDHSAVQKCYLTQQAVIHYLKMHSYFLVNLEYRENIQNGRKNSIYPLNLTFRNFFYFLAVPTLVYQDIYPQRDKFRLSYFLFKVFSSIACIVMMYYLYTDLIHPHLIHILTISSFEMIISVYIPFLGLTLLQFFMMFECICPAYAEITMFGDRLFYDDF